MMAARLAEAAAEVTPAVRHRYRRERSALQPVPERDVGVQQLRYGAGLFRVLGNLRESGRSEEHTSELQVTNAHLVCRLLLEKKKKKKEIIKSIRQIK